MAGFRRGEPAPSAGNARLWLGSGLLLAATVAAWLLLPVEAWIRAFVATMAGLGIWGVVVFAAVYILGMLVLAPGSAFSIAAGVAFGLWGVPFVLVVATAAAATAFLIARYLARGWFERALERRPNFLAVKRAIDAEGWKVVGLIRLSPPVPFAITSYFFGVTRVGFWPFVATTAVGVLPATFVYVNIGAMGQTFSAGGRTSPWQWGLLALGVVATVTVGIIVTRKAREMLRQAGGDGAF